MTYPIKGERGARGLLRTVLHWLSTSQEHSSPGSIKVMPPDTGGSPVSVASAAAGRSAADDATEVKEVATAVGSREADGFTTGFTILNTKGSICYNFFKSIRLQLKR
jgi:hypothetical protein